MIASPTNSFSSILLFLIKQLGADDMATCRRPIGLATLVLIGLLTIKLPGQAVAIEHFSATAAYKTLHSAHFLVDFNAQDQELAELSLTIAEQAYQVSSARFDWKPRSKIHLVISDQTDLTNGYATPLPFNRIVIFTSPPSGFGELHDNGSWLERLILHEMVHIIHIDKASGVPELARHVFGRNPLLFPNALQPTFLKEGLATYFESSQISRSGRAASAYFEMIQRVEVASGMLPLSKVQQFSRDWPLNKAYVYGSAFFQFLGSEYGPEAIDYLISSYSDNLIPFLLDGSVRKATTARDMDALWQEFEHWMTNRYAAQIEFLNNSENSSNLTIHTELNSSLAAPVKDSAGNLYIVRPSPYKPFSLVQLTPELDQSGFKEETLISLKPTAKLIGASGEHVWLVQPAKCTHRTRSFDLFEVDIASRSIERLTHCKHFVEGDLYLDPEDGPIFAMIAHQRGRKELIRFALGTQAAQTLVSANLGSNMGSPKWVDDGQEVWFTSRDHAENWKVKRISSTPNLTLNAEAQRDGLIPETVLEQEGVNFFHFDWSPQAEVLAVTADRNNQIEIWKFQPANQMLTQLTQQLGGSAWPLVSDDGTYFNFLSYTHEGWRLSQQSLDQDTHGDPQQSSPLIAAPALVRTPLPDIELNQSEGQDNVFETHDYNPLLSIYPRSWFLTYAGDDNYNALRFQVFGRDSLNFHNWFIDAGRDTKNDLNIGLVSYTFLNHFNLSYERFYDYSTSNDQLRVIEENTEYSATAFYQTALLGHRVTPYLGINQAEEFQFDRVLNQDRFGLEVGTVGVGLILDSSGRALRSLGPSWGRRVSITHEHDDVQAFATDGTLRSELESDGKVWTLDWREYLPLFTNQRIALRAFLANADSGADVFDLSGSSTRSLFTNNLLHKRDLDLRAYPDSSIELIGRKPRILSADYEFPLWHWDEGVSGWPIGLYDLSGTVFYESGKADNQFERYDSYGIETELGIDLGYSLVPLSVTFGAAQPLQDISANREKDPHFYLRAILGL